MEYSVANINYNGDELSLTGLFETDHIFKHLNKVHNFYELKLLEKVKSLKLKGTYIDVGANIGNHTVFFSKFCDSDNVISIELDSKIFEVLNKNVEDLKLTNVTTLNIGVGEKYKLVKTSDIDKTNVGMTKIVGENGDVVVDTLDSLLSDINDITLIKLDVEGYEKNVLLGAKELIKKHSPIIIAELRDGKEFDEFELLAKELGYYTDKINYASTPTYFWYKKNEEYDYIYIIPSYERFEKVSILINEILNSHTNTLIILLNDNSTDDRYEYFANLKNVVYLKNPVNNGKDGFWKTVNRLLTELSKYKFKYGIMLGDDFKLVDNYLIKLKTYESENYILRLFTQESIGSTNWGYQNWIDGAFCAPYSFFQKINFELFPIIKRGRLNSSGVGLQMSKRLNGLNITVKTFGSLIEHIGNDDSKMHPELRINQPLIAGDINNDKVLSIIISTYDHPQFLSECLNSIIDSIKNLNCEILVGIDNCEKTLVYVKDNSFDNRIRFYFFEKNVGPYIVKNSLSKISNSDYILFFDSDDIIKAELIDDIITNKNTYDLIKPMYLDFQKDVKFIDEKILLSKTYGEGVFGVKKELFLRFNGFEGWRCAADSDLMGRLYKNKVKLIHTKRIGFYRRIHSDSLTQRPETNFFSPLRAKYASISKHKQYHGPLDKLIIEPFYLVINKSLQYSSDVVFVSKEEKIESIKQKLGFETKQESNKLDYDIINNLNNNPRSYNPSKHIKPIRENIPVNRNELFEIKRGTLAEQNREFFPMKRKLDL